MTSNVADAADTAPVVASDGGADAPPSANVPERLVGYWSFDEGSGTTVHDQIGNGNDGTIRSGGGLNSPAASNPKWVAGHRGMALVIRPTMHDWVDVPDSDSIDRTGLTGQISISAWIRVNAHDAANPRPFVVHRGMEHSSVLHFALGLFDGKPLGTIHRLTAMATVKVPILEWVHLGLTYDGFTQRVFMNGMEVATNDIGSPIAPGDSPIVLGAAAFHFGESVSRHIDGAIDEIRIWDGVLTAAEMAAYAAD